MAKILVYDDSDDLDLSIRVINACGHVCRRFDDGQQLVVAALEDAPDLVVINPHISEGDGIQALERLKKENPDLVVALYADASLFGESCSYFVADAVLMKRPGHDHLFAFIKATFDTDTGIQTVPYHEFFF